MVHLTLIKVLTYFAPILLIQLVLDIYCIVNILKKGVRNLNKPIWILIVLCVNIFGAIAYLALGRRRWEDDQNS